MQNIPYGAGATKCPGSSSIVAQGTGNPSGCSRGATEDASNKGEENNAGSALVIPGVADSGGGAAISHKPVRGVLRYVCPRPMEKRGTETYDLDPRLLASRWVLHLGGTFDSAGFLMFYTLSPSVDRLSHLLRELRTRGGGRPSRKAMSETVT